MAETTEQRQIRSLKAQQEKSKTQAAIDKANAEAAAAKAQAAADAAQAQAQQAQAKNEADARAFEAERKSIEAQRAVDAANRKAEDAQRAASEKSAGKVGVDLLATAGKAAPFVAGAAVGLVQANRMNAAAVKAAGPKVKQFEAAGRMAEKLNTDAPRKIAGTVRADKLKGVVQAADAIGIKKLAGKVGIVAIGGLAAEGLATAFIAPKYIEDPIAKEAVRSAGGVSLGAAATIATKRKFDIATFSKNASAASVAAIEGARNRLAREGVMEAAKAVAPAAAQAAAGSGAKSAAGKFAAKAGARLIPGLGWALAAGGAVIAGVEAYKRGDGAAGIAKSAALGAVGLDGLVTPAKADTGAAPAKPNAAPANPDGITIGQRLQGGLIGVSTLGIGMEMLRSGRSLPGKIAIRAAGAAATALGATFTATSIIAPHKSSAEGKQTSGNPGALAIAKDAAARTSADMATNNVPSHAQMSTHAKPVSDGMTEDYLRVQAGRTVHVKGYSTPTR